MFAHDCRRNSALDNAGLSVLLEVGVNETGSEFREAAPKAFFEDMGERMGREHRELNAQPGIGSRALDTDTCCQLTGVMLEILPPSA